jgi:WD40 repeat protein
MRWSRSPWRRREPGVPRDPSVFISYSRNDTAFADDLVKGLAPHTDRIWIDREDIPPGSRWWREILAAIRDNDVLVFIASPDSLASEICRLELEHASEHGKRIVWIAHRDVTSREIPERLKFLNERQSVSASSADWIGETVAAIRTDFERLRAHTDLDTRAAHWDESESPRRGLLRGAELRAAEELLRTGDEQKYPVPTGLQRRFCEASRRAATRRKAVSIGLIIMIAVVGLVLVQRQQQAAQERLSSRLATASADIFAQRPQTSMLLAVEAFRAAPTAEARNRLLEQVMHRPGIDGMTTELGQFPTASAFSRDRQQVAVLNEHDIAVWDLQSYRRLARFTVETDQLADDVNDIAFSPDGRTLATVGYDAKVNVYSLPDGAHIATLVDPDEGFDPSEMPDVDEPRNPLIVVDYSPDGRLLAVGGEEGRVVIWDVARRTRHAVLDLSEPSGGVSAVVFSPDGKTLAVNSGGSPILWNLQTGDHKVAAPVSVNADDGGDDMTFSPDGALLALPTTVEAGQRTESAVALVDTGLGQVTFTMARHEASITALALSPDGRTLATADSSTNDIHVWNVSPERQLRYTHAVLPGHPNEVTSVAFAPDGRTLISLSEDGAAMRWDLSRIAIKHDDGAARRPTFSPTGELLATVGVNSDIMLWDVTTRRGVGTLEAPAGAEILDVVFSPDASVLAAVGTDGQVHLWDVERRRPAGSLTSEVPGIGRLAFSPDGHLLFGAPQSDRRVARWDVQNRRQLASLTSQETLSGGIAVSPNGQVVAATVADSGKVVLWDGPETSGGVTADSTVASSGTVAFSPDGQTIAVSGYYDQVAFISVPDRLLLGTLDLGMQATVNDVVFSPDGQTLAAAVGDPALDGAVVLVDATQRSLRNTLRPHVTQTTRVAFSPDGRTLASASVHHSALWDVDSDLISRQLCRIAGRALTREEWTDFMGSAPYSPACR